MILTIDLYTIVINQTLLLRHELRVCKEMCDHVQLLIVEPKQIYYTPRLQGIVFSSLLSSSKSTLMVMPMITCMVFTLQRSLVVTFLCHR